MKKLFNVMAVMLFVGSLTSMSPAMEQEEYGKASDCAQYSRNIILNAAQTYNLDISREGQHFNLMMEFYHDIYLDCLND
ncbi:hypothetical protein [Lacinutrix undariae]